jgi:MFS family permease
MKSKYFCVVFFYNNITEGMFLLFFFLIFITFFALSLGPVTWVVVSEIFPTHIRGRAMSIATFAIWGSNAVVGQTFPWLLENLGSAGPFWLYAIIVAPALLLVLKVIPETKGKTLEEIESYWKHKALKQNL